jgi:HSP20 family protein
MQVMEVPMVERSHTAGWLPQVYGPLRKLGDKVADWFAPKADAAMSDEYYEISLELPGVATDDISVSVQEGALTIQGEKRFDHEEVGRTYFFSEREFGAFQRSFRLPPDAAKDRIDASFKNGVLNVRVPKLQAAPGESQKICVRTE